MVSRRGLTTFKGSLILVWIDVGQGLEALSLLDGPDWAIFQTRI